MNKTILSLISSEDVLEIVDAFESSDASTDKARCVHALKMLRGEYECAAPVSERFSEVVAAAEKAVGCRLTRLRAKETTLVRCFVSYRLREEGYTYAEIGRMMERDHSTVTSQVNKVRDMISVPLAYKTEMEQFEEFERLLGKA